MKILFTRATYYLTKTSIVEGETQRKPLRLWANSTHKGPSSTLGIQPFWLRGSCPNHSCLNVQLLIWWQLCVTMFCLGLQVVINMCGEITGIILVGQKEEISSEAFRKEYVCIAISAVWFKGGTFFFFHLSWDLYPPCKLFSSSVMVWCLL